MGWDAVVERFLKRSPLTVMTHLTLRRALAATWLDALFAQHAERQYVRSLLFSTVVDLLASVTFGFRPSLRVMVTGCSSTVPVAVRPARRGVPDSTTVGERLCLRTMKTAPWSANPSNKRVVLKLRSATHNCPGAAMVSSASVSARSWVCASSHGTMSTASPSCGSYTTNVWPGSAAPRRPRNALSRFSVAGK